MFQDISGDPIHGAAALLHLALPIASEACQLLILARMAQIRP
jgi:hypothetical protein